ncbi:serine protease [Streptomyces sp. NPDC052309]|uniref:serine protease n=1 Tax=Streptomyces sp. NPDC052309 TaxID=3155421 RepID=UPI003425D882
MPPADAQGPASPAGAVFERGFARLLGPDRVPIGAGFLLTRDLVCTCAHVLVDRPTADSAAPDGPVLVDFPLLEGGASEPVEATVAEWHPADDIAVLRPARPVEGTEPLPLTGTSEPPWGREARVYGFPDDTDTGVNAHGILRGGQGAGRVQLDTGDGSVQIAPGFSGSPVWDVAERAVVGVLATRGRRSLAGTAYLIPARRLAALDGVRVPGEAGPFKGLLRFDEEDAHLFHGREKEVAALTEAVNERPLTLLTGQSGTGKSSVLRAGLLPGVRASGAVLAVRTPRESDDPAEFLGEALLALWDEAEPVAGGDARATVVREALAGDGLASARLRERLRAAAGSRLCLLVLDQFEEYAAAAPREARTVVTWLRELTAVADPLPGRGLRAVLSARHATLDALGAALPAADRAHTLVHLDPLGDEALNRVISERLRPIPGAGLEAGLADLLLRDARAAQEALEETNSLPLLEFTLAELWRRRSGGLLTHAAYGELGGLSGALARHAQRALDQAKTDRLTDEQTARRLFQRLARPDGLGRFVPDSVPAAELDADQLRLAHRMVREKLLVWRRPPSAEDSGESLRMAHEALLREWEWLRTCLREGEAFRAWQAEVDEYARAWRARGGPAFAAVPDKLLAVAARWQSERGQDVTDVQRAYLAAGRRRARRGTYVLVTFAAVVTVLTVVAGLLARGFADSRDTLRDQLRAAASDGLADLAEERSPTDFGLSVQTAMGAWATAPGDKARAALFRQYLRMRDVERVHSGLWSGTVSSMISAPGEDVLAVVVEPEDGARQVHLIREATTDHPRAFRLRGVPGGAFTSTFSDDGRWYAAGWPDGSVRLWQVGAPDAEPRLLTGARPDADRIDQVYGSPLDFSDDGSRLLRLHHYDIESGAAIEQRSALDAWEVPSGEPVAGTARPVAGRKADGACFADGRTWTAVAPTDGSAKEDVGLAVWRGNGDGEPRLVAAVGDTLLRLRPAEGAAPAAIDYDHYEDSVALSPDGSRFAVRHEGRVYVGGPGAGFRSAAVPGEAAGLDDWQVTWVPAEGGDTVAVWDPGGRRLSLYAADDPARRTNVDLRARKDADIESVARLGNGELAVLLSSNEVLRVDPRIGMVVAPALPVAQRPKTPSAFSTPGRLVPRPGHDSQALIVTRSGHRTGQLMIWDLAKGTRVANWETATGVYGVHDENRGAAAVMFSEDGSRVAIAHEDHKVRFREVAMGKRVGGTVPFPTGARLVTFSASDTLDTLVVLDTEGGFALYEVPSGRARGAGPSPVGGDEFTAVASGTTVHFLTGGQVRSFSVDPGTWWKHLCRAADRPYTAVERDILPAGARTGPPCSES